MYSSEPPKFTQKPMNKEVKEGAKAAFSATAKGKPVPEITWHKGEVQIVPTDRIKIETKYVQGDIASTLTVDKAELEDAGELRVNAKNPAGQDNCMAKFIVQSKWREWDCIGSVECVDDTYVWMNSIELCGVYDNMHAYVDVCVCVMIDEISLWVCCML